MTIRPPDPAARFTAFLSRFPAGIVALVNQCLPRLSRALPGSNLLVYDYANSLVVSFGMSERGYEAIVALSASEQCVRLYFDKSLPDPRGLLEGSGTKVRSVVLHAASDLDDGDVHALLKAAIAHSGIAFEPDRPTRMIIKSDSTKRKSKAAGRA